jgi:hypothetical protein
MKKILTVLLVMVVAMGFVFSEQASMKLVSTIDASTSLTWYTDKFTNLYVTGNDEAGVSFSSSSASAYLKFATNVKSYTLSVKATNMAGATSTSDKYSYSVAISGVAATGITAGHVDEGFTYETSENEEADVVFATVTDATQKSVTGYKFKYTITDATDWANAVADTYTGTVTVTFATKS